MNTIFKFSLCMLAMIFASVYVSAYPVSAQEEILNEFDMEMKGVAQSCSRKVISLFNTYLDSGALTMPQLFDTFYIPIPDTDPPKYHTQYDKIVDESLQTILDQLLSYNNYIIYIIAVDTYGYLPAYNSRYSHYYTGNREEDLKNNKAKRILNDHIGLAASRNIAPYLVQQGVLDTGEKIKDCSLPLMIRNRHWGAVRIGYTINN